MDEPVVDCHVHVFDPARFPYDPETFYAPAGPEIGTVAQLQRTHDAHDVRYALLVGPNSGYGEDSSCLLDALAAGAGRFRGVAVVPSGVTLDELDRLRAAGVVGVTLNAALLGVGHYGDAGELLSSLADLDMWADVQVTGEQLPALAPLLLSSGARVIVDHCGRPQAGEGVDAAGFRELLRLGRQGRALVKLSGLVKFSDRPPPHEDTWPFVHALVEAFGPDRCVWGSDWPFLRAPMRIDYGPLLALLRELVPDRQDRRRILWDTPRRAFGFPG
jgi:predicted TIM-barrel fold metal-dependent hydrolase